MVVFNPSKREIGAKIVYYGPALCGKTTNLQHIHKKLNPNQRGELVSLATKDDRTLFFDFLPLDLGKVKGFNTRFHLYTVPGQVYYVSTRRAVLTGVDGIIFVADSQDEKMAENIESLEDLEKNLSYYGKKLDDIPMVMQYNKCDLKNLSSLEELNRKLNKRDAPYLRSSAAAGQGVMETLTLMCKIVLQNLEDGSRKTKPVYREVSVVPSEPPILTKPTPPKSVVPAPPAAEPLIEIETEEDLLDIEKLKAERRATIDKLLSPRAEARPTAEMKRIPEPELEEFEDLDESKEERVSEQAEALESSAGMEEGREDATVELGKFEGFKKPQDVGLELELEPPGEPVEFEEAEREAILLEPEKALAIDSQEEIEIEAEEQLEFEEAEALKLPQEELKPEFIEKPIEPELAGEEEVSVAEEESRGPAVEILSLGEPQKLLPSLIKIPLIIRLHDLKKEVHITIRVELEDFVIE